MCAPGGPGYPETQFLITYRLKLWEVLQSTKSGPLRYADLKATGLTQQNCRDAASLERMRLRNPGLLPGMGPKERARKLSKVIPAEGVCWTPPGRAAAMWRILADALDERRNAWGVEVGRMHTEEGTVRTLDLYWHASLRKGLHPTIPPTRAGSLPRVVRLQGLQDRALGMPQLPASGRLDARLH